MSSGGRRNLDGAAERRSDTSGSQSRRSLDGSGPDRRPSETPPLEVPDAQRILALQRLAGNSAICDYVKRPAVQRVPPPPSVPPAAAAQPTPIGYVYVIRGELQSGEAVYYTGSTLRSLVQRIFKDRHTWRELARSKSTIIDYYEIKASLDVARSGEQTLRSATNEALRSAEQVALKRERSAALTEGIGRRELNDATKPPAAEANIDKWGEIHGVRIGPRQRFGAGIKIGAFAALQLLDIFLMFRDAKLAQYVTAPYLLEDESGVYSLQETDRGLFRPNWYWKKYYTGPLAGQRARISKDEFNALADVAETLWGTTDWKGDFVPGILRQELPVIEEPPAGQSPSWA